MDEERISALLDQEHLEEEERQRLQERLESDGAFRAEYQTIKATRATLRRRAQTLREAAPADIRQQIIARIREEARAERETSTSADGFWGLVRAFFGKYRYATAALAVVTVAVVFLQITSDAPDGSDGVDFISSVFNNYTLLQQGHILVDKETSSEQELRSFFDKSGLTVSTTKFDLPATLVGGFISESQGYKVAHVVYRDEKNEIIYICQVPKDLFTKKDLAIDPTIMQSLSLGERHCTRSSRNTSLAMWERDDLITSVVAKYAVDDLLRIIQN